MIDAGSKQALYVNQAYEAMTGRSCQSLMENPSSYEDIIHPDDRVHVLGKLGEAAQNGQFNERYRIVGPGDEVRWVWAQGFPVRDSERQDSPPVNWRSLRTSCATWMVHAGADPKSVQGQMRHSRISTTMDIYAQFVPEGQKQAQKQLRAYVERAVPAVPIVFQ
jgi:integrase